MPIPMSAPQVLDRYFLEMRCKVLDVAAALDRMDRAGGVSAGDDARVSQLHQAIDALREQGPGRAETVQRIFSLAYDPDWPRPVIGE
jgi:hypothetical protein